MSELKKLYNCKAKYNETTLVSYDTTIIKRIDRHVYFRNYLSPTTRYHISKYIQRLDEIGEHSLANTVMQLYDMTRYKQPLRQAYALVATIKDDGDILIVRQRDYDEETFRYKYFGGAV